MKSKLYWVLTALFSVQAFAGPSAPLPGSSTETTTSYVLRPEVGRAARAEVGESLYSEATQITTKDFIGTVKESVVVQLENYRINVKEGARGPIVIRRGSPRPMMCFHTTRTGLGSVFGNQGHLGCLVDTTGNKTFDIATFAHQSGEFPIATPVPYSIEVKESTVENKESFLVDVLYQGMSKGEVKISYRESSNGLARPAFTQDVSYELEKDGTAIIGFKGMRLKVLKATGQSIEYVLEQPIPSFAKIRAEISDGASKNAIKPWYQ